MAARLRLTRKFAQVINGIDLSRVRAGDEIEVSERDADVLIAEGWAIPARTAPNGPGLNRRKHGKRTKLRGR